MVIMRLYMDIINGCDGYSNICFSSQWDPQNAWLVHYCKKYIKVQITVAVTEHMRVMRAVRSNKYVVVHLQRLVAIKY